MVAFAVAQEAHDAFLSSSSSLSLKSRAILASDQLASAETVSTIKSKLPLVAP
jgi:hypothetical protein